MCERLKSISVWGFARGNWGTSPCCGKTNSASFAPSGLVWILVAPHSLRCGLHSIAASRLDFHGGGTPQPCERVSVQVEVDFDGDLGTNGMAVFHPGLEPPVLHRFDGLLIKTHSQAAQHANVGRPAVDSYDQSQSANALILGLARLF